MKAVMSYWSAPERLRRSPGHEALWGLSFACAQRAFGGVTLVTDKAGAVRLVEDLGLPFDEVRVTLDGAAPEGLEHVWAAGKLRVYQQMEEPFIHLDHDVFLFKRPPEKFLSAGVFAQHKEHLDGDGRVAGRPGVSYPLPLLRSVPRLPALVRAALDAPEKGAHNFGVFGGSSLDCIHEYANQAIATLRDPANFEAFRKMDGTAASMFLEQFFLTPFAKEHGVEVTPLLFEDASDEEAEALGYAHFAGESKHTPQVTAACWKRISEHFPHIYRQLTRQTRH